MLRHALGAVAIAVASASPGIAQDMEPKAYSATPVGATFLVAAASRSSGSILFDPTLPIEDASATINGVAIGVGTTFGVLGKLMLVSAVLPIAWGEVSGRVGEDARSVTRAGVADSRYKVSVNLRGNDAMPLREFVKAPRHTIVGTSLTIAAPSGEYDRSRLINLGNNRWALKPEIGIAVPRGAWDVDAYIGAWLFTSNPQFYPGGAHRTQDPVIATQGHVSYTFKPRLWLAVDATWYAGGGASVNQGQATGRVNNARLGATLSLPASSRQSFKISYSSGVTVRSGTNFRTLAAGWQWLWLRS